MLEKTKIRPWVMPWENVQRNFWLIRVMKTSFVYPIPFANDVVSLTVPAVQDCGEPVYHDYCLFMIFVDKKLWTIFSSYKEHMYSQDLYEALKWKSQPADLCSERYYYKGLFNVRDSLSKFEVQRHYMGVHVPLSFSIMQIKRSLTLTIKNGVKTRSHYVSSKKSFLTLRCSVWGKGKEYAV